MLQVCALAKYKTWKYEQETRSITGYTSEIRETSVLYRYDKKALKRSYNLAFMWP